MSPTKPQRQLRDLGGIAHIMDRAELAQHLKISTKKVDELVKCGLPYFLVQNNRRGGIKRFRLLDVHAWLDRQTELAKTNISHQSYLIGEILSFTAIGKEVI